MSGSFEPEFTNTNWLNLSNSFNPLKNYWLYYLEFTNLSKNTLDIRYQIYYIIRKLSYWDKYLHIF